MPDLVGFDDMNEFGEEIDEPIAELEQDVYHRLVEAPGSNMDVPDEASIGVEDALNGPIDASMKSRIEAGLMLDERIDAVKATVTEAGNGSYSGDVEYVADGQVLGVQFDVNAAGVRRIT